MGPTQELVDELFREQVLRARATPPEQRVRDSLQLFELTCRIMLDGIRNENPEADEARSQAMLVERLDLLRRLERVP